MTSTADGAGAKQPSERIADFLTEAAQWNLWENGTPGAAEAAARAVLISPEPPIELGPEVLDAALAGNESGNHLTRLAEELRREVLSNPGGNLSPSAARAVCAYLYRFTRQVPPDLTRVSLQESVANIEFAHVLALMRDRELLLCRIRREMRKRPVEVIRQLEAILASP